MDEPPFRDAADVDWTEVKVQQHGDRRVSVWERFLDWAPEGLVLIGRYDPATAHPRWSNQRLPAGAA